MLIHVVKPGETLWRISSIYNVPMARVAALNELPNPNRLLIGQALVIPTEDVIHVVRPGENLWRIAQQYGVSVQEIVQRNQITNPNYIYPGLQLIIPAMRYRVQPGDTLWGIAQRFNVDLQDLLRVNGLTATTVIYPGNIIVIPRKDRPEIEVNGYIYNLGEAAVPIVREDAVHLTYLSPFAYLIKEDGELEPIDDVPAIRAAYGRDAVPMMAITNFTVTQLGQNLAHVILTDSALQETLLTNIINIMVEKDYMGLNIDFENVLPEDRENYNNFVQLAVDRLHPRGFFVSTALAPKVSADQPGLLYEAHDYEAHGRIADFVILMTYEWGYRRGAPQAISPLNQIRRVLDYAVTVIPREKIFFGFQIYARDWIIPHVQGQEARTISMQEAIRIGTNYGTVIQYDETTQSPFFRYRDEQGRMHEVWFEDAR
ncbi:MAG: LysM peptidoglycan-binding domain-containing protein, partial [Peptostreptococcales bacterium]